MKKLKEREPTLLEVIGVVAIVLFVVLGSLCVIGTMSNLSEKASRVDEFRNCVSKLELGSHSNEINILDIKLCAIQ